LLAVVAVVEVLAHGVKAVAVAVEAVIGLLLQQNLLVAVQGLKVL
jgi:hypothetical protein